MSMSLKTTSNKLNMFESVRHKPESVENAQKKAYRPLCAFGNLYLTNYPYRKNQNQIFTTFVKKCGKKI
jgi:hypothetical protein